MSKTQTQVTIKRCPDCGDPYHMPGQSEFSNCGESELIPSHFRFATASVTDSPMVSMSEYRDPWARYISA